MMNNLILRTITGAVYVAIILAGVLEGAVAFLLLCCLLGVLAVVEFSLNHLRSQGSDAKAAVPTGARVAIGLDAALCATMIASWWLSTDSLFVQSWAVWLVLLLARLVYTLFSREAQPIASLQRSMMGQMYIALPLTMLQFLYSADWHMVLLVFVLIWVNDTGAYLVGVTMGRHRLCPRISPKKSWEGFFGGLLLCIVAAVAAKLLWPDAYFHPMAVMVGFGAVVCIFATLGDLLESLIKRTLGVKDSGKLLPGHGGILDRIDSLLMVAVAAVVYLLLLC